MRVKSKGYYLSLRAPMGHWRCESQSEHCKNPGPRAPQIESPLRSRALMARLTGVRIETAAGIYLAVNGNANGSVDKKKNTTIPIEIDGEIVKSERLEGSLHRLMKKRGRSRWNPAQSKKEVMEARFEGARKILGEMEEGEEIDEEKTKEIALSFLDPKEEHRLTVTAVTHKVVAGKVKVSVETKLGEERHTHVVDIGAQPVPPVAACGSMHLLLSTPPGPA